MMVGMEQSEYVKYTRLEKKGGDYAAAMQLVKAGKAKVHDVNCVTMRSGEKATLESVREYIFPTEYELPELPSTIPPEKKFTVLPDIRIKVPTAFETRNLGTTLEFEPTLGEDGMSVDLRIEPEFIDPAGYATWLKYKDELGQADIKMPKFYTQRSRVGLTLMKGKFSLANTFSGKDDEGKVDSSQKVLMFVMVEVVVLKH
ncbi:hypothetical protein Rhal01_03145 [Rubritalea halochordaticola]|uniref:Uncharacterized protein n=1 Tax=Rubritalea halochordaticola TaxID=714537 RepID=A0ABP9V8J9_9BACT